jgi:hypothetical protein
MADHHLAQRPRVSPAAGPRRPEAPRETTARRGLVRSRRLSFRAGLRRGLSATISWARKSMYASREPAGTSSPGSVRRTCNSARILDRPRATAC